MAINEYLDKSGLQVYHNKVKQEVIGIKSQLEHKTAQINNLNLNKAEKNSVYTKSETDIKLKEKASESSLEVERARITNLASMSDGATTNDAELRDIRVMANGLTASSAGESVRKQFITINNITDNLCEYKNIIDPSKITKNYYCTVNNSIQPSASYFYTEKINVKEGETINISSCRYITAFNSNLKSGNQVVSGSGINNNDPSQKKYSYIVPNNINQIIITGYTVDIDTFMVNKGDKHEKYIPYGVLSIKDNVNIPQIEKINKLKNLTLYNFGDSIAAGDGNNGIGYAELIAEKYEITCNDYAKGGATLSKVEQQSASCILDQITNASTSIPDIIFLDGGANDFTQARKMGTVTEWLDFNGNYDITTYVGALEQAFYNLMKKYIGSQILFIITHRDSTRWDKTILETNVNIKTMHDLAIEACNKWSIPYIDLFYESGMCVKLQEYCNLYTNNSDGTHPNKMGYEKFYIPKIINKLNSLIA